MMQLGFMGGAMEIGGSCIYLRVNGKGILLDAGIRQGGSRDPIPDFRLVQELGGVDAILISHAHMDHTGTLPVISKAYPLAPVYMTAMTADLVRVLLADSLKIMNRSEGEIPHYAKEDVTGMLNRVRVFNFRVKFPLFENIDATFYPAGHIAGAACIYLESKEGSVFYSGDFCAFPQKTIEGIHIPKLRPDVAIVETTYGDRLHANRQVEENNLISLVAECVRQGDKVLIPAFALGRAQEVLLLLKAALQNGQLPSVPVYVDGMVRDINQMYERNPAYLRSNLGRSIWKGNIPFYTEDITPVAPEQNREELLSQKGPAIFVASSGMLNGGPSVQYAKKIAAMENGCILLTGYQDEESPGRRLMELLDETSLQKTLEQESSKDLPKLTLDGVTIPVRCRIYRAGLSAHGDQGEIEGLLERLSPKDLFLVHGDRDVIEHFGKGLNPDYPKRVFLPECGAVYTLNYRKKRKQLSESFPWSLRRTDSLTEGEERLLWEYVREYYPQKALTCEQLLFIWSGKNIPEMSEEAAGNELSRLQNLLRNSPYFSPDSRRLFLFHANNEEEVCANLAPKEWTNQQLKERIQEQFGALGWKKISFYGGERKVLLNFDFPDAVNLERFHTEKENFFEQTGWQIELAPSMNFGAAMALLTELFGNRVLKTSYFVERREFIVKLSGKDSQDTLKASRFLEKTGWQLHLPGDGTEAESFGNSQSVSRNVRENANDMGMFVPEKSDLNPMEQNMVLYCVDQAFEGKRHELCKKSIRSDSMGKYLELAFLSPEVGRNYSQLLSQLANQLQWRIAISDSVNQNGVFETARKVCIQLGIHLWQNPSYLPLKRQLQLKTTTVLTEELVQTATKEILDLTGLECIILNK